MDTLSISTFAQTTDHPRDQKELIAQVNERLVKHQGEFTLLVDNEEESRVRDAPSGPHDYYIVTELYLGIVNKDTLVSLNSFEHAIPTDRYTSCRFLSCECPRVFTYQGNLRPSLKFLLHHLDLPLKAKNPLSVMLAEMDGKQLVKLGLYVGDEEVFAWAGDNQDKLLTLKAMTRPLGRPLPQAIRPQVKAAIAKEKEATLRHLAQLLDQYFALLREIRAQGEPRNVEAPLSPSGLDDPQVLFTGIEVACFGPLGGMNEKLEQLKHEIRVALAEAHQLGLRNKSIIKALVERYQQILTAHLEHISKSGHNKQTD